MEYSLYKHTKSNLNIVPLNTADLRKRCLYDRADVASTEFAFTRFLVPYLVDSGPALFCDCDQLFVDDVQKLFDLFDPKYAVQVVKHDYTPKTAAKMDGQPQVSYPRKNWSSVMLFNCDHYKNLTLSPYVINRCAGAYLHRFQWLDDEEIGSLPTGWNYLVGEDMPECELHNLHYTLGGPWFKDLPADYCPAGYAELWNKYKKELDSKF